MQNNISYKTLGTLEKSKLFEKIILEFESRWSGNDYLSDICRYSLLNPGKMLRPLLLIESARLVGGKVNKVIKAAAGVEIAHIASLMHDDIIDDDNTRRGIPASHIVYGKNDTIVAGDALIFDLFACLAECSNVGISERRIIKAISLSAEAGRILCQGQILEGKIKENHNYTIDTYLQMIEQKTAILFKTVCEVGGILGGGDPHTCTKLSLYGRNLGIAFQMIDDLLPYISDSTIAGKNLYSDIINNRPTLPILIAYENSDKDIRDRIETALYGNYDFGARVNFIKQIIYKTDAINIGKKLALEYGKEAKYSLIDIPLNLDKRILNSYVEMVVERCK